MPPLTPEEKKFLTDVLGIPAFLLDWDVAALTSGAAAGSTPPFSPYGAKPFRHPTPDPMRMREDHDDPGISPPIPRAQVEERLKVFLGLQEIVWVIGPLQNAESMHGCWVS